MRSIKRLTNLLISRNPKKQNYENNKIYSEEKSISTLLHKHSESDCKILETGIPLRDLLHSDNISKSDRDMLLDYTVGALQVHEIYQAITDWLTAREAARQKPSSGDKFADY